MKKQYIIPIALLFILSCKKYEDGPAFSLRKPEKRLCRKWVFSSTEQNGNTVYFNYNPQFSLEFKKNGAFIATLSSPYNQWGYPVPWEGTWQFFNDKENIYTSIQVLNDTLKILRLTSKELWLLDETYQPNLPVTYKYKSY